MTRVHAYESLQDETPICARDTNKIIQVDSALIGLVLESIYFPWK